MVKMYLNLRPYMYWDDNIFYGQTEQKLESSFKVYIYDDLFWLIWFSADWWHIQRIFHPYFSPITNWNKNLAINPDRLRNHSLAEYGNNSFVLFLGSFQYFWCHYGDLHRYQIYLIQVSQWITFQILLYCHWFCFFTKETM